MANIFGVTEDTDTTTSTDESPELNLDDFVLDLSDEDLDSSGGQYIPIPVGTTTGFRVYELDTAARSQAGNPQWKLTLNAVEDTWGKRKRVLQTITFSPKNPFIWGPFLKGLGLVQGGGQVNLGEATRRAKANLEGKIIMARVQGYSWKDENGNFQRSFGNNKKAIPTDGTPYHEELHGWALPEDEEEQTDGLSGLGSFSADDYL